MVNFSSKRLGSLLPKTAGRPSRLPDEAAGEEQDSRQRQLDRSLSRCLNNLDKARQAEARAAHDRAVARNTGRPLRWHKIKKGLLVTCILTGFFFSLLDTTIVSTSLLATSEDLNGFRDSSWVVLSYLLAYMGFSIFFAKLSDIYGRRNILIAAWIIFVVSSIACGCSSSMTQLIVCRALQGMGGAGLYSLTTITIPEIGPAHRPDIIGKIIGLTLSMSFVLGPVLGGIIPEIASWRVLYWLNAPFAVIAIVGIVFLYPKEERLRYGIRHSLRRIDFIGSFLSLASTVLLVFALQEGGSLLASWDSLMILLCLTASGISFLLFVAWETWLSSDGNWDIEPIFPLRLLKNRVYLCCLLTTFLLGYVYLCLVIIIPQRFQIVNGQSVFKTGLHLLPMLGGTAVGCIVSGPINAKKNRTGPVVVVSCVLMLVSDSLLATVVRADYPTGPLYAFLTVYGFGFGMFMAGSTMMSTAQVEQLDHAVGQGAISQLRILGGVIGLAIFTIIFNSHIQAANVTSSLTPEQLDVLRRSPSTLIEMWPELQTMIKDTYAAAFHLMACIVAGVTGMALLVSLGTLERNPPQIHRNMVSEKNEVASAVSAVSTNNRGSGDTQERDGTGGDQYQPGSHGATGMASASAAASGVIETAPTLSPPPRHHLPSIAAV